MDDRRRKIYISIQCLNNYFMNTIQADSESTSDDDDIESMTLFDLRRRINPRERIPPRIQNYYEQTVPLYSAQEFQQNFRVSKSAFRALSNRIIPHMQEAYVTGAPIKNPRKQLLAVLWLLATPDSYRSVSGRFNLGKASLFDGFLRVVNCLNYIEPEIIKWPTGENRVNVQNKFQECAGIQGVIGAIDGTFIPITAPRRDKEVYITRKSNYAMTLQAVAEPSLKFTDCFIGFPGSVSDARIFRNSHLYQNVQLNQNNYFPEDSFIIGDKAYPLLRWCLPPYIARRRLTPVQVNFNNAHAKTRQVIERAFALLFGRFRRLKYLDMHRTDLIPKTVIAACVLHNICLNHEDLFIREYIEEGQEFVNGNNEPEDGDNNPNENFEAEHARDLIALQIFNRRRR